jgi:hypothetical protein
METISSICHPRLHHAMMTGTHVNCEGHRCQGDKKVEGIQRNRLPQHCIIKLLAKEVDVIPEGDGRTNSLMQVDGTNFINLKSS